MPAVDRLVASLAEEQNGAFAWWQISSSVTQSTAQRRTEEGRWVRHRRGVYSLAGAPDTWERRLRIALLEAGRGAVISHRSAAALHGLPGFPSNTADVTRPEARSNTPRLHSTPRKTSLLPTDHIVEVKGFPTTTLARTLFDLAGLSSPQRRRRGWHYVHEARVARALDDAIASKHLQLESLVTIVDDLGKRGRPGTQLMRRLVDERSDGSFATESELEELFLRVLGRYGISMPQRQRTLGNDTAVIGRVDFVYPTMRLVIEVDSRKHHSALSDWEHDKWRDLQLAAAGWRVLRISWHQLTDQPEEVARLLKAVLARAS